MQIKTGTAAVTNGSQRVTASVGTDWSQAVVAGFFSLNVEGAPVYEIGAIYAPGAPGNTSTGSAQWQIDLTGNYLAATNAAAAYLIHKDFFDNKMPIWNTGDTQFKAIQNRANAMVDAFIGTVSGVTFDNARPSPTDGTFQIFNPDQELFFTLRIRGDAGAEVLSIEPAGEV